MFKHVKVQKLVKVYEYESVYDEQNRTLVWFDWNVEDEHEYITDGFLDVNAKLEEAGYTVKTECEDDWIDWEWERLDFTFQTVFCYPHNQLKEEMTVDELLKNVATKVTLKFPEPWFEKISN